MRRYLALAVMAALAVLGGALSAPAMGAVPVVDPADLAVTMTADVNPVPLGQTVTYTITVLNRADVPAAPDDATLTTLTDTLPSGVDFVSATASQGTCSAGAPGVTCALGTIVHGASVEVQITVRPTATGPFDNTVFADAAPSDPMAANNTATLTSDVVAAADLSVAATTSEDPVLAGGTLTYTLTVTNSGGSTATSVALTDTLPPGTAVDGTPAASNGGTCAVVNSDVTCDLVNLTSGATATVTIAIKVPGSGPLVNMASVAATELDPVPANNTATTTTAVTPVADLSVTAAGSPTPAVNSGAQLIYSLAVTNSGPSPATNVTVANTLPPGVALYGIIASQGRCVLTGVVITCTIDSLGSGATATVSIQTRALTPGAITDTVSVTAAELDPQTGNNNASVATTVNVAADLALTAEGPAAPVPAGGLIVYRFVVTNTGPSQASSVTLEDTLPAGVSVVSAEPDQGLCTTAGQVLTCSLGIVPSGIAVAVEVQATPSAVGTVVHNVSVRAAELDPDQANNSAALSTQVTAGADLVLTQRGARDQAAIGDEIRYVLRVVNRGPSASRGVRVVSRLGSRFILGSALPSRGRCVARGKTVTCLLGRLAKGTSARITIVVVPMRAGVLTNTVRATGKPRDGQPLNSIVEVVTDVSRTPVSPT